MQNRLDFNLEDVILNTNNKVSFSIPTGGIYGVLGLNTFRKLIEAHYLSHSSDYVDPPSINIVRPWFSTIRYGEEVSSKGTLKKNLLPPRTSLHRPHDGNLQSKEATKGGSSKAPTSSKTGHSKKRKESSSAMDSNLSQPLVSTHVDTGMHKEDQQETGGPTSLGVTSKERANPQLSSGMSSFNLNKPIYLTSFISHSESASGNDVLAVSTAEADPENYAPSTDLHVLTNQTKSISEGLETVLTQPIQEKGPARLLDKLRKKKPLAQSKESDEEENDEIHATENVETKDTLVPKSSSLKSSLIQELTNQVATIQAKLKTLDALPGLLSHVTKALNKCSHVLVSASSKDGYKSVPSTGQADTMPAEGEKNTNQATISQLFQRRSKKVNLNKT
ncbi:hypothetical protein Tco_0299921 [Tanacetum coccineum]